MSQVPKPYDRVKPFGSASSNNPSNPIQGTALDAEFNAVEVSLDQTQARLAEIQRDDGALANDSVGPDQFSQEGIDYVEQLAADSAASITGPAIVVMNQIKAETLVIKDQAVVARDQAEDFAADASSSAAAAAASASSSSNSATASQNSANDSASSADAAEYYVEQLSGALDALAPRTIEFTTSGTTASHELPVHVADEEFIDVHVDGLLLAPTAYSVVGTTLSFTPSLATGKFVVVKIASGVQIMPIVVEDWGFVYESIASAEDWGQVA